MPYVHTGAFVHAPEGEPKTEFSPPLSSHVPCLAPNNRFNEDNQLPLPFSSGEILKSTNGNSAELSVPIGWAGSKFGICLEAFVNRLARSPLRVNAGITGILQSALARFPSVVHFCENTSFSESPKPLLTLHVCEHAILLECIGLGALILREVNYLVHIQLLEQIEKLSTKIDSSMVFSSEVVVAQSLFAFYCFLSTERLDQECQNRVLNLSALTSKHEWEILDKDVRYIHTFVTFLFLLDKQWDEVSKYVLLKVRQILPFDSGFPLVDSLIQEDFLNELSQRGMEIVDGLFECGVNGFGDALPFCLSLFWSLLIKKALLHPRIPDSKRAQTLEGTSGLICLSAELFEIGNDSIMFNFYLHLANLFGALLLQNYTKAKNLLQSLIFLLNDSIVLHLFIVYPKLMHTLHFLCIAFSKLELHDSFDQLRVVIQATSHCSGTLDFPACCPLSLHGVCEGAECEAVWRLFQISDVDVARNSEDSLLDFLVDFVDVV